ncbi:hypothetical protein GCM10007981_05690 [Thermocladium modestius]|uniref:Uncharacterized protein n=1 Tax=Thermocladium modestius TaxID=62609 RepID=A0A830GUQ8_9CREN|nr:hypothetical protein [Thermocladium modestius]GGP19948.1 hypothetical protein GCM10007981_05690 [Thermocladium modestius]
MFDVKQIRLGLEEWRKLSDELRRIGQNDDLEVLMNIAVAPSEEEGDAAQKLTNEMNDIGKELESEVGAAVHVHAHEDHFAMYLSMKKKGGDISSAIRTVASLIKSCEFCSVHGIDGEIHLGDDVSAIFFGDPYKMTFILPGQDGRRLIVMEMNT